MILLDKVSIFFMTYQYLVLLRAYLSSVYLHLSLLHAIRVYIKRLFPTCFIRCDNVYTPSILLLLLLLLAHYFNLLLLLLLLLLLHIATSTLFSFITINIIIDIDTNYYNINYLPEIS